MCKIEIKETTQALDYWLSQPYLSGDVRKNLANAKVILVPEEGFRDRDVRVFPVGTEEFFNELREKLPDDLLLEIAIKDDDYKEVALHSAVLILGGLVVTGVTLVVLPVLVNVVSEYVNRRLYSDKDRAEAIVRWELTVVDGSRAAKISNEGPAIDFQSEMERAISELPTMVPPPALLTNRAEVKDENAG
jgi:hypothetical protein